MSCFLSTTSCFPIQEEKAKSKEVEKEKIKPPSDQVNSKMYYLSW